MKTLLLGFGVGTAIAFWAGRRQRVAGLVQRRAGTSEPTRPAAPTRAEDEADDLDRLTRSELYERAQKANIPGRSAMSKNQLIAALRNASS
jgi:hypothetical protein